MKYLKDFFIIVTIVLAIGISQYLYGCQPKQKEIKQEITTNTAEVDMGISYYLSGNILYKGDQIIFTGKTIQPTPKISEVKMIATKTSQSQSIKKVEKKKIIKKQVDSNLPNTYYFSHYNVGDYKQTDKSPCHGASGPDLCVLAKDGYTNPIAITVDVRNKMGLKRWDKIQLSGPECQAPGTYTVLDEMGPRFRNGCIKKGGVCIKGDIVRSIGQKGGGGVCNITKI